MPHPVLGPSDEPVHRLRDQRRGLELRSRDASLPSPGLVATDNVGNSSPPATTSITVKATYSDLCKLTVQFSTKGREDELCKNLTEAQKAEQNGRLQDKQNAISAYVKSVTLLSTQRNPRDNHFTAAQAATLIAFANSL